MKSLYSNAENRSSWPEFILLPRSHMWRIQCTEMILANCSQTRWMWVMKRLFILNQYTPPIRCWYEIKESFCSCCLDKNHVITLRSTLQAITLHVEFESHKYFMKTQHAAGQRHAVCHRQHKAVQSGGPPPDQIHRGILTAQWVCWFLSRLRSIYNWQLV